MIAKTQYTVSSADLELLLVLSRGKTLAKAGALLDADGSTIFRSLQRIEKGLGQRLFERSRSGYQPTDTALRLLQYAETIESNLQAARDATLSSSAEASGLVRISAVDAVLNSLVVPALSTLVSENPHLQLELHASNELTSLTRRDVDIAIRSTAKPPPHLIGKRIGSQRFAVFAQDRVAKQLLKGQKYIRDDQLDQLSWIGIDDAMPEHPGVLWRKRNYPNVRPMIQANNSLTVADVVEAGLGIGVVALFHAKRRPRLVTLTAPLKDCEIDLWMVTHPESRHLRRIAIVAQYLANNISLNG